MKPFAKFLLVIPAYLLLMNAASAAFFLSFNPTAVNVNGFGSSSFTVEAQYLNIPILGGNTNNLANFSIPLVSSNGNFTLDSSSISGSQLGFLDNEIRTLGTVNVTHVGPGISTLVTFGTPTAAGNPVIAIASAASSVTLTAVPEPSSLALLGVAGLGFVIYRKRRAARA